tara:strand:+ start:7108 stop:7302 length:195 start_codon:yes stop_codon:yes gene_type:complete
MSKDEAFEISAGEEGLVTCVCGNTTFKDESPTIITITGQVDGPTASAKKCVCCQCGEQTTVQAS